MTATTVRRSAPDAACLDAVEPAREAAEAVAGPGEVGDHLGAEAEGERVVTHRFACLDRGYRGWHWAVTVARAARARQVTVDEVALLPGDDALLPPPWVPWSRRLKPGDLGIGDLLPTPEDDPRLVPTFLADPDPDLESASVELGLGRARVLSVEGRTDAVERWYSGDHGPEAAIARAAPATCATCGFYLPLGGPLRQAFGVCANEYAPDDGQVVSVDHGCGAHSEAVVVPSVLEPPPLLLDEHSYDVIDASASPLHAAGSVGDTDTGEPLGHS